jgi:hypothetical protein
MLYVLEVLGLAINDVGVCRPVAPRDDDDEDIKLSRTPLLSDRASYASLKPYQHNFKQ